ncbi:MAG: hypothetical protein HY736_09535 [Verrucomicrobia bacterium]|nr:hypothetical protein [Verrucomicrobiota bacterium]
MILGFGGATRLQFAVAILAAILFPASAPAQGKTPPAVSRDQGVTWENEIHLVDPERDPDDRFKPGDVGYPAFQNLPDGRVLVVFYSHLHRGDERAYRTRTIANVLEEVPAQ